MKAKVSISNDLTVAITPHSTETPGVPTVFPEAPAPMFWPPGMMNGQNKLTYSVLHRGLPIAHDDHDIGTLIPHLRVPPDPANDAANTAASSRKIVFGASSVKAQRLPIGAAGMIGLPPLPMLCCADPMGLPVGGDVTNSGNTVQVKITPADIAAGLAHMATEMLTDYVANKLGDVKTSWGWAAKTILSGIKNVAVGSYKAITTDDPVEIKLGGGVPKFGDLAKSGHGFVRDENGNWKYEDGIHLFNIDVGFEIDFDERIPIKGKFEHRKLEDNGDVVVERDGKKVTYRSDPELGPGNRHGAPSVEDAET